MGFSKPWPKPRIFAQSADSQWQLSAFAACAVAADFTESNSIRIHQPQAVSVGGAVRVTRRVAGLDISAAAFLSCSADRASGILRIKFRGFGGIQDRTAVARRGCSTDVCRVEFGGGGGVC